MTDHEQFDEIEWHKKTGVKLFNATWDLIDKKERTTEEIDQMIHSAHASRYHWGESVAAGMPNTGPINLERGEWQISRVYSILERPESAIYHAQRCIDICEENNISDFDLAFAYESMARACAVAGDRDTDSKKYVTLAIEAGNKIKKEEDKIYFFSELDTISG
ncbi:MAG: hypothetical protein ACXADY_04875 [Candidatus Hodarchaeales archaeon]|jgi:hypothetical protein